MLETWLYFSPKAAQRSVMNGNSLIFLKIYDLESKMPESPSTPQGGSGVRAWAQLKQVTFSPHSKQSRAEQCQTNTSPFGAVAQRLSDLLHPITTKILDIQSRRVFFIYCLPVRDCGCIRDALSCYLLILLSRDLLRIYEHRLFTSSKNGTFRWQLKTFHQSQTLFSCVKENIELFCPPENEESRTSCFKTVRMKIML